MDSANTNAATPLFLRIMKGTGYATVGLFILVAQLLGSDTDLSITQFVVGLIGCLSGIAIATIRAKLSLISSDRKRFYPYIFIGGMLGATIATALFGESRITLNIMEGLGAGTIMGIEFILVFLALRASYHAYFPKINGA